MKLRFFFTTIAWMALTATTAMAQTQRYADHSVLAQGQWAAIRIPATGIYQLTDSLLTAAGFDNPDKVRVYGYGGAWQPEVLTGDYLKATDDLPQVPVCQLSDGTRLFFAVGPVNWDSAEAATRLRNTYSDYGYYFLTESDAEPLLQDSATFVTAHYPHPNDYHALYEVDNYSWFHGGRTFFDEQVIDSKEPVHTYVLPAYSPDGKLFVSMSYHVYCDAEVSVNDLVVGHILVNEETVDSRFTDDYKSYPDDYSEAAMDVWKFDISGGLEKQNTITIRHLSGGDMHLDYIALNSTAPRQLSGLDATQLPVPEYVGSVANQDHHADGFADMVIIIPESRQLQAEAERLAQLHRDMDHMRVTVVTANELYNEFSSGTPDANAYRRYMKMLYDRATTPTEKPRFLLMFGDGAWDNRMLTSNWRNFSPKDFLLCYESANSFSETQCFVSDDYFCLLDDDEGDNMQQRDKGDVAVGRLPARTAEEARIMVDKIISYRKNEQAGAWQNIICMMGDDGNSNQHMNTAEVVARIVEAASPAYQINRVYWDAYKMVSSANGDTYPDITRLLKQQMKTGALVMNYSGHGGPKRLSHENVLQLKDFAEPTSMRLPLWVTASCDIMGYDGQDQNLGETAMLNPMGGAIAFFGTARTVYASKNQQINAAFMKYVLSEENGRRLTIGEAARKAKNEMVDEKKDLAENKLQYSLLGDPALVLAAPTLTATIDSINGQLVDDYPIRLTAGSTVTVAGHIENHPDFKGMATITVRDAEEIVYGNINNPSGKGNDTAFVFTNRPSTLYMGNDSIVDGRFRFTFAIPLDISYSDGQGQILVYGVNEERSLMAHGQSCAFTMGSQDGIISGTSDGPSVRCYLDYDGFQNGGKTGETPFFYAQLYDEDGINVSGNGIGHDMELVVDGMMSRTYNLNDYFIYDFGDYRKGEVGFTIPMLSYGNHQLLFRAWDVLNNSTAVAIDFVVEPGYKFIQTGIHSVMNEEVFNRRRQMMSGDYYDAQGRHLGSEMPVRQGLYIYKSKTGITKKFFVKGNK